MGTVRFCDHCKRGLQAAKGPITQYRLVRPSLAMGNCVCSKDEEVAVADFCADCAKELEDFFEGISGRQITLRTDEKPECRPVHPKETIKLAPGTRTHHTWTEDEDKLILDPPLGMSKADIAQKVGATISAVNNRRHRLLNGKVGKYV